MKIGIVGLGRMGMNMARRLLNGGHTVIVYNRTKEKSELMVREGALSADSLENMKEMLGPAAIVWLMLPSGTIVDEHIDELSEILEKGDIIVEGGNSYYKDDIRRYSQLKEKEIHYIDAGVSGGIWGLKEGYCIMAGGDKEIFEYIEPVIEILAPKNGYMYCGNTGSGHFVKMIHNGIEYAMMEAYGEGFELLKASQYGEKLDLSNVADMWNHGSVIRSWLLELLVDSFKNDPALENIQGYVQDSGEGRWTVLEAVESGVSAPVIAHSLFKRFQSRQADVFSDKVIAALRKEFGGHAVAKIHEIVRDSQAGAGNVEHAKAYKGD